MPVSRNLQPSERAAIITLHQSGLKAKDIAGNIYFCSIFIAILERIGVHKSCVPSIIHLSLAQVPSIIHLSLAGQDPYLQGMKENLSPTPL